MELRKKWVLLFCLFAFSAGATETLSESQWIVRLSERLKGGSAGRRGVIETLKEHELQYGKRYPHAQLLDFVQLLCLKENDVACLRELLPLHTSPLKRARLHLALAEISGDWRQKHFELQAAVRLAPSDPKVQFLSQFYSLEVAEKLLEAYQTELYQASILRKLGLEDLKGKKINFVDGMVQVLFNTVNMVTLMLTDRDEYLLREWNRQIEQISQLLWGVRLQKLRLQKGLQPLHLLQVPLKLDGRMVAAENAFLATPFYRMIRDKGLYEYFSKSEQVQLPSLQSFNFMPRENLVQLQWSEVLLKELNVVNVLMILKGPALVEAFVQSRWGVAAMGALRLQKVAQQISTLPKPMAGFLMWFAMETADGCTLRWAYMTKLLLDQSHSPNVVELRAARSLHQ